MMGITIHFFLFVWLQRGTHQTLAFHGNQGAEALGHLLQGEV